MKITKKINKLFSLEKDIFWMLYDMRIKAQDILEKHGTQKMQEFCNSQFPALKFVRKELWNAIEKYRDLLVAKVESGDATTKEAKRLPRLILYIKRHYEDDCLPD